MRNAPSLRMLRTKASSLTALQLQLQLVERAGSDTARVQALADLKSGLQRTTHTIQQMLTLARQEPGAAEHAKWRRSI